jgi:hypothetical protein
MVGVEILSDGRAVGFKVADGGVFRRGVVFGDGALERGRLMGLVDRSREGMGDVSRLFNVPVDRMALRDRSRKVRVDGSAGMSLDVIGNVVASGLMLDGDLHVAALRMLDDMVGDVVGMRLEVVRRHSSRCAKVLGDVELTRHMVTIGMVTDDGAMLVKPVLLGGVQMVERGLVFMGIASGVLRLVFVEGREVGMVLIWCAFVLLDGLEVDLIAVGIMMRVHLPAMRAVSMDGVAIEGLGDVVGMSLEFTRLHVAVVIQLGAMVDRERAVDMLAARVGVGYRRVDMGIGEPDLRSVLLVWGRHSMGVRYRMLRRRRSGDRRGSDWNQNRSEDLQEDRGDGEEQEFGEELHVVECG